MNLGKAETSDGVFNPLRVRRICVVGGGFAGVVTSKALLSRGFSVSLFEKQSKLGGLWVDNYYGAASQVAKDLYEYPEKSYGEKVSRHPTAQEIQDYIVDFAAEHSVLPLCKMEHSVESITRDCNESPWVVTITKPDGKLTTESFDFVVLCTGALGQPKIPAFLQEVKNIFKGSIVHSSQWKHPEVFDGKTVVVVGNGRGATDAIVGALPYAQEAHQIVRTRRWYIPLCSWGIYPCASSIITRLSACLSPLSYRRRGLVSWICQWLLTPIIWLWFRICELVLIIHYQFPFRLLPASRLEIDISDLSSQNPKTEYFEAVRSRRFQIHLSSAEALEEDCVVLKSGEKIKCDFVVAATGYTYGSNLLNKDILGDLHDGPDGHWLYRHILHPKVPNLAFVGSNALTLMSPCTQSLQAAWLARALTKEMPLPSRAEMMKDIQEVKEVAHACLAPSARQSIQISITIVEYHDLLCTDMGFEASEQGIIDGWIAPATAKTYRHAV